MRSRRARLGRAVENIGALDLAGRTWDDPFDVEPDVPDSSLVVEVEPFPTDPNGTIVLNVPRSSDDSVTEDDSDTGSEEP